MIKTNIDNITAQYLADKDIEQIPFEVLSMIFYISDLQKENKTLIEKIDDLNDLNEDLKMENEDFKIYLNEIKTNEKYIDFDSVKEIISKNHILTTVNEELYEKYTTILKEIKQKDDFIHELDDYCRKLEKERIETVKIIEKVTDALLKYYENLKSERESEIKI